MLPHDVLDGDEEFTKLQEAYQVLNDHKKRAEYDTAHRGYVKRERVRDR